MLRSLIDCGGVLRIKAGEIIVGSAVYFMLNVFEILFQIAVTEFFRLSVFM